jgi:predicted Zn-dependent peptidase
MAGREAGPIVITTNATTSREAVKRIVDALDRFAERGVTEAELTEAKGYVLGRLLFRYETPEAASAALADLGYFGESARLKEFAWRVLALHAADVSRAASRFYDSRRAVVVIAGR